MLFDSLYTFLSLMPDYNLSQKGDIILNHVLPHLKEAIKTTSFNKEQYSREILHQVLDFDVVLIGWMPGQKSPIHNHPINGCLVYPIQGELHEERFCGQLNPISESTIGVGQYSYIDNGICVHRLGNASSSKIAISVHIYSPSNFVASVFDHKENIAQDTIALP